jgi:ATP-dependent Zn protease
MVDIAYERTLELMRLRKDEVASLAELLLEKEIINHDDIVSIIGHRPFEADSQ